MFCFPIVEATKGAYTFEALEDMPFYRLLEIWEAVSYSGVVRWLATQPSTYKRQEPRDHG